MATTHYEVRHAYRSTRDGQQFGPWAAGDRIELAEADAEWVNRDSPGCLLAAGGIVEPEPERQKPAGRDRQHRGGANRGR
jgi:hypothetical protein